MTEEQIQRRRERDRERKARKRAEKQLAKQNQAACIEIESAMQSKPDPDMWTPFMVQMRRQQREHSK